MADLDFLNGSAVTVAPQLLGWELERIIGDRILRARIVEVEAYDQTDAASHSYKGQTQRTEVMFGPAGHMYVYFTYGMHYCMNIVTGPIGNGSAVLLRAAEPIEGIDIMADNRRGRTGIELTNGPAKLCQALAIDSEFNGIKIKSGSLRILPPSATVTDIVQTTRIGISKARDTPWRFYVKDNPYVSKRV